MTPPRLSWCLAALALLATACTAPEPAPQPLTVGVLVPLSGPRATVGAESARGAELAVEVVNGAHPDLPVPLGPGAGLPRLRGARLALATGDTAGQPDTASAQVAALVERRAAGLVSADTAEVTAAAGSQAQRLRVPLVDARSTADYLTELGIDWYFRTGPSDSQLAEGSFALLARRPQAAPTTIALVTEAGADGAVAAVRLRELARRDGVTVTTHLELTPGPVDPAGVAEGLARRAPHAVFAWARTAQTASAVADAAGRLDGAVSLFGLGEGFRALDQPSAHEPGLLRAVPWSAEFAQRSPVAQQVGELYRQRFGRPMSAAAVDTFTAVLTLASAMDGAGSADRGAIRTALRQTAQSAVEMIVPWNGVRFGPDGQNVLAAAVVEQWQERSFRLVHPVELAAGAARWDREPQP